MLPGVKNQSMKALFCALLVLLLLAACVPQGTVTPTASALTVTDALGRQVTLPAPPQRIVFTGRALFMLADAAYIFPGAAERIVAMASTGQGSANFIALIDPAYAQKAVLDSQAGAEQVAALQPDLVIMKSYLADDIGASIEALGIPVVYLDLETVEQYSRDLMTLGRILGDEARAAEVVAFYRGRVDAIRRATAALERPRVLLLYYNDRDGNVAFNVPPLGWLQTEMVEIAGGEPVWADANPGRGWAQVTLEQIVAWDADQIFVISYFRDPAEVVDALRADPNWQAVRAVRDGALYAFPGDLYSWDQPDPRWILGLTWLAGKIHPQQFADLDMVAEVRVFYQTLYGLDAAFVEQNILPAFRGDMRQGAEP